MVRIELFGPIRLIHDNEVIKFQSRISAYILGYLVIHAATARSRTSIAEDFWPNHESLKSRKALNTEMWRLRSVLSSINQQDLIWQENGAIGLTDCEAISADYTDFKIGMNELKHLKPDAVSEQAMRKVEKSCHMVSGELLEGCYYDWLLIFREEVRNQQTRALSFLMRRNLNANRYNQAIFFAQKLIELDPLLEDAHRVMMQAFSSLGNRAAAIHQFDKVKHVLRKELNVSPLEETINLHNIILNRDAFIAQKPLQVNKKAKTLEGVISNLKTAEQNVREARRALYDYITKDE